MQLGYVIIYVESVLKTVVFYEKAFGIMRRFVHESEAYAEMETGSTALSFVDEKMMGSTCDFSLNRKEKKGAGAEIAFVTESVEQQFQYALNAGATEVLKPTKKPWGQIVSYVRDNNGFLVEICSPVKG